MIKLNENETVVASVDLAYMTTEPLFASKLSGIGVKVRYYIRELEVERADYLAYIETNQAWNMSEFVMAYRRKEGD